MGISLLKQSTVLKMRCGKTKAKEGTGNEN